MGRPSPDDHRRDEEEGVYPPEPKELLRCHQSDQEGQQPGHRFLSFEVLLEGRPQPNLQENLWNPGTSQVLDLEFEIRSGFEAAYVSPKKRQLGITINKFNREHIFGAGGPLFRLARSRFWNPTLKKIQAKIRTRPKGNFDREGGWGGGGQGLDFGGPAAKNQISGALDFRCRRLQGPNLPVLQAFQLRPPRH